jgi:hypothetical protein
METHARRIAGPSGAHLAKRVISSMRFVHDLVDSVKDRLPAAKDWC